MKLSKNIFKTFFFLVGTVAVYVSINFFIDLHRYFQLSLHVKAYFEDFETEEVSSGKYIVVANYNYRLGEATYHKKYRITKPVYPNIFLAKEHLEKWERAQNWVWVNPKNPHQSALIRIFPLKKGVHLALCIGIFFYFLWLNFYVHKMHPEIN